MVSIGDRSADGVRGEARPPAAGRAARQRLGTTVADGGLAGDALALADGRTVPLDRDTLYLGRALTNDIVIDDELVAARHARLQRFPEGWVLTDLGSSACTAVNGQRLTRPLFLEPGDTIQLGRVLIELRTGVGEVRGDAAGASPRLGMVPQSAALICLHDVVKSFQTAAGPQAVLRGVSLAIQAGEFVAIVGPSGCGKSTLLNMITGIDQPDAGEVIVGGQNLQQMGQDALVGWRGRNIGIVFQFFQLLPTLTVAENVMLPMAFCNTYPSHERRTRALELLGEVGIDQLADRLPSSLSGGEQQRAAIARALANDPPLLVADEPTGNLDSRNGGQIFELLARIVAGGTTVLTVTHDPVLAASVPRRIEMVDGRIVRAG